MTQFTQRIDWVGDQQVPKPAIMQVEAALQVLREYLADNLMAIGCGEQIARPSPAVSAAAVMCRTAARTYAKFGRLVEDGPPPSRLDETLNITKRTGEQCAQFASVFFRLQGGEQLCVDDAMQLLRSLRSTPQLDAMTLWLFGGPAPNRHR